MSLHSRVSIALALLVLCAGSTVAAETVSLGDAVPTPKLGHVVDEDLLEPWKLTVFPAGTGLPSGSGFTL